MAQQSSWREEDLLDLERCGLAADLASTNLSSGEAQLSAHYGDPDPGYDVTYDMTEVLDKLLDDNEIPLLCDPAHHMTTPTTGCTSVAEDEGEGLEVFLGAPSAYGIKTDQERVTYLNRGYSYAVQLKKQPGGAPSLYKSTLTLTFCKLRWRNGEKEHFEQWSNDHPHDRLLEIDSIACDGLVPEESLSSNTVHFTWSSSSELVIVAIKINCLSTEFAAKKHGGEKGVLLRLVMEVARDDNTKVYQGGCGIKVFKDKGGDRKQRLDQVKVEKMSPDEQFRFHSSETITKFTTLPQSDSSLTSTPYTPISDNSTYSLVSGESPYSLATPPCLAPLPTVVPPSSLAGLSATMSVQDAQKWLVLNRFGPYSSLFTNYTGADMLRLSRKDLMDLCGHGDGIRLYNSLRTQTLKTLYITCSEQGGQVYQAVYLEELSAHSLLLKLLDKLGDQQQLPLQQVSAFLRLTSNGVPVRLDDTVVQSMADELSFILIAIKEENGLYQVILKDHTPSNFDDMCVSFTGNVARQ